MVVMKDNKNPETNPLLVSGKMMRVKRVQAFAPATFAASSSSLPTCIMAVTPVRLEKGRFLATDTTTNSANVPYSGGIGPTGFANMEIKIAPNAMPGMT